mgnify:CR=1 FL=1
MLVRVLAKPTGKEPPQSVEYTVSVSSRELKVTDEMVEALKAAGTLDPERFASEKKNYEAERKEDPSMPVWEDFFTYGYDLKKIFKYQPIKGDAATAELKDELETFTIKPPVAEKRVAVEEDDDEPVVTPSKTKAKKPVVIEEESESDDEELDNSWM